MSDLGGFRGAQRVKYSARGFWSLFITQFQGAFNDNVYQYLILFATAAALQDARGDVLQFHFLWFSFSNTPKEFATTISNILFALPFILFAGFFGALADKYSKQRLAVATKVWEVGIMALGAYSFYLGNPWLTWGLLFLMATQSTMFAPSKYGLLPETLPESRLSWANGIIQMGTLVSIILGVLTAGQLFELYRDQLWVPGLVLVCLSTVGLLASLFISRPPPANPALRVPRFPIWIPQEMRASFRFMWRDRVMFNVVIGYVYFWFAGALARNNILVFFLDTLKLPESQSTYYIGIVTFGIGAGALLAGFLSRGKIELGLIPIGAAGMALFALLLAVPSGIYDRILLAPLGLGTGFYYVFLGVLVAGLGIFAGLFDVPLISSIQQRAPVSMKGSMIAATNMLTWLGIFSASWVFGLLTVIGLSSYQIFMISGAMSLGIGLYISMRVPLLFLRAALWLLSSTSYRIRTLGRQNIPDDGGALFVSNIMAMPDLLALIASTDRAIRPVLAREVMR
ncbi:MAG: MFS transporter, partial [Rectinema sp.]|nr:MFS transporter [Rectinema sp.]